jgi:hypothetical protein
VRPRSQSHEAQPETSINYQSYLLDTYFNRLETLATRYTAPSLASEVQRRWISEAADYIHEHLGEAIEFLNRPYMHFQATKDISVFDGIIAEFGVFQGESINNLARILPDKIIYGFDSFEGLREDWKGQTASKGAFSLHGQLPEVETNVHLIKGWFDETLPNFLDTNLRKPFSLLHIDCDTYEATKTILDIAGDRIVSGTIVIFDEYFGYRGWKCGEFKAWAEFVKSRALKYKYRGFYSEKVYVRVL